MLFALARSPFSLLKPTSSLAHAGESIIEWKYTNGLRQVAYACPAGGVGAEVGSAAPSAGCPQAPVAGGRRSLRRAGAFVHPFQVRPPRQVLRGQLPGERLRRARIHAPLPAHLPFGADRSRHQVFIGRAVLRGLRRRSLAAEQRDPVRQLLVRDRVVADEQLALVSSVPVR